MVCVSFSRCLFERSVLEKTLYFLSGITFIRHANLGRLIPVLQSMFICPIQYSTVSQSTISQSTVSQSTVSQSTISQSTVSQSTVSFRFAKYRKPVLELLFSYSIFVLSALCCIVRSLFYVTGDFHRFLH